ncbi:MAG TPA: DEAD/DEAH box helicase, partial [Opitutaceae bacterium]|nr:DEAD/DEAH box helicase [Opitutaceae bacterium]
MFDPQTAALIRAGPKLPDLVLDRLPEEMTRVFAEIVALRLRLATGPAHLPAEVIRKLEEFRRIAVTYEAMVLLMPSREDRSAAAFVAAQTHHLLHLARRAQGGIPPPVLSAESISPEISALLLFLIANQPSDAMEMAREIESAAQEQQSVLRVLTAAICALGKGELGTIVELSYDHQILEDYEEAAVAALYGEILTGIKLFADFVLHADRFRNGPTEAMTIFLRVQKISVEAIETPIADFADSENTPPVSSFAGPHHLASLLLGAAANLGHAALAAVPPPPGLDGSAWSTLVSSIATRRPFLWPNHLAALELGFLNPGTSSVVSFPTGGGKTTLSELKIATVLANGGAVIYLAPTHALVGQTKRDLTNAFSVPVRESFLVEDYYAEI